MTDASNNGTDMQSFVVIDRVVVTECDGPTKAIFAAFFSHFVFNLEYPTSLKFIYKFLEEYVFSVAQKTKPLAYRRGLSKFFN